MLRASVSIPSAAGDGVSVMNSGMALSPDRLDIGTRYARVAVSGQRSAVSGQRSAVSGQRSAVSGQRSAVMNCVRRLPGAMRSAFSGPARSLSRPEPRLGWFLTRSFSLLPVFALLVGTLGLLAPAPVKAQTDNRPSVQFAEINYITEETDTTPLYVNVSITPALSEASRVKFTTSGPATRNVDYTITGLTRHTVPGAYGTVSHTEYVDLPAGATRVTLVVRLRADNLTETNETALFQLTSIDTANAPYKIGNPASTEIILLDNSAVGIRQDAFGVSGALPWEATLKVRDVSRSRGSNPMAVRKKKNGGGQHIACTGNSGLATNESCTHGFVYEKVALSSVTGRTSFTALGCRNGSEVGKQCLPQGDNNALSDNGFVHGGVAYRVQQVTLSGETLTLAFDRPIPDSLKSTLVLTVGGSTVLRLSDASHINGALQWGNTGLNWSVTDPLSTVSLRLEAGVQGGEGPGSGDEERDLLTASFEEMPGEHDGTGFAFRVRLSETVGKFSRSPRASSFAVTQGRVTGVEQIGAGLWRVTVQPASLSDVTVTLAGGRDCDDEPSGAVCTPDGRSLSNTSTATIVGSPLQPEAEQTVAVEFGNVPSGHDGRTPFTLEVQSGSKPAADAFTVTNGTVMGVESLDPVLWQIRVAPKSWKDVTVALGEASVTVPGPVRIRVANAKAKEGKDESLDFAVTLNRAAAHEVSVDYATKDGTATAGSDYVATSGTLTFAPGETERTVSVAILDDVVDEGKETFVLRLSNPQGAYLRKIHRKATGTIRNNDPMPGAWLTRFGRTVGQQAVDAIEARRSAARTPGFSGTFAGQALPTVAGSGDDESREAGDGPAMPPEIGHRPVIDRLRDWLSGDREAGQVTQSTTTALGMEQVLAGTAFALTQDTDNGASLGLWGAGAYAGFSGREGGLSVEGDVSSFMLGTDWARGDHLLGLMLAHSRGSGSYSSSDGAGEIESRLTSLVPYANWDVSERVSVWGAVGLGRGDMTLRPEDGAVLSTDIDWRMAAAGADGSLGHVAALGGADLRWTADALWTRTTSEGRAGLAAVSGDTTRLRFGVETGWTRVLSSGAVLSPRLEMAARHDGGDAETGFGVEIGGGLDWFDPVRGLEVGVTGRRLVLHEQDGFEDWGVALTMSYDPTPDTKRGFSAGVSRSLGGASSGGMAALLGPQTFPTATGSEAGGTWSAEMAYGVSRGRGMVASPYTRLSGGGGAEQARLGYRVEPDAAHAADMNLDLWLQPGTANTGETAGGGLNWRW